MSRQANAKELQGMKKGYMGKIPASPPAAHMAPKPPARPPSAKEKQGMEKGYMGKIPTSPPVRPTSPAPKAPVTKIPQRTSPYANIPPAVTGGKTGKEPYANIPKALSSNNEGNPGTSFGARDLKRELKGTAAPRTTPATKVQRDSEMRSRMTSKQEKRADAKSNYQTIPNVAKKQEIEKRDKKSNYQTIPTFKK